jgi:cytochrome c biogenesis protein CcdA
VRRAASASATMTPFSVGFALSFWLFGLFLVEVSLALSRQQHYVDRITGSYAIAHRRQLE